ncbi:aldehyde ferredoxin oxidoreductase family protein [Candidatus Bipolaricaulota bacterium]|nr:aldehyde ferredoxin oxidoreductase family protein [Candidatus Bipolaricaulota bacterium]
MTEQVQFHQLRIDLDSEECQTEGIDLKSLKDFYGGVGYASKLLYKEMEPGLDPLGPENKLILATGPLTHPVVPGGGSLELCFKSPLTNAWGESRVGCDFGLLMKQAGVDYLIIEGAATKPSMIVVDEKDTKIVEAKELQGKTVSQKRKIVHDKVSGEDYEIMTIGPAGENLVSFSNAMIGDRAAGRVGVGAVLGSKNLLALAVKGTGEIPLSNKDSLINNIREVNKKIRENPETSSWKKHGTTGDIPGCDELGDWPTKNWKSNSWGKGEEIYDDFFENNLVTNEGCYTGCPIACGRRAKVGEGKYETPEHGGGEYESISAFTSFVLNEDVEAAVHSTYLCNEYGLDTISAGANIAFLMDCYEEGLIDVEHVGKLDLSWGNSDVLPKLVKQFALREGIGELVANGVKGAARKIGEEAEELAIHGKGLEAPAHDPRSGKTLAISYGTANRGMCHIHPVEAMAYDAGKVSFGLEKYGLPDPDEVPRWKEEGKGEIVKTLQDGGIIPDIVGTCKFFMYFGVSLDDYAEMLESVTGWDAKGEDLLLAGERTNNLQRLFNIREGFSGKDDRIPKRMKSQPEFGYYVEEPDCSISDYQGMLNDYYEARGWDKETGKPTGRKLEELGLDIFE